MIRELFIMYGLIVAIVILAIGIILWLASRGWWFMKIAQGTTAFLTAGDSLKAILPNVGGYRMSEVEDLDGRHWLVPEKDDEKRMKALFHNSLFGTVWFQKWLWKTFGVKFISLVWPHVHVHQFDIRKGGRRRVEARSDVGLDAPLRSRVVDSDETTKVNHLLFMVPRPVYLEGVELAGDNSRINLLLLPVYRQVIPSLPVYYLKGDFFTLLDAAIEAAMVDFFASYRVAIYRGGMREGQFAENSYDPPQGDENKRKYEEVYESSPLTYAHWLKLTKAGEGSPLEEQLRRLNVSKAYLAKLKAEGEERREITDYVEKHLTHGEPAEISGREVEKTIPSGIIPRFGFALVSFRVVEWEAHKSTEALAKALLAKETELHTAEGVRAKASGERDAILARAEGESSRYQRLVNALVEKGVTPDVAAGVVQTQLRTENIRDSKLTTYVEGGNVGSGATPVVPLK